jgi:O-antigen/teichoic acid export membrane protein
MQVTSYLISPLMFGLIAVSTPLIKVLLGDKWLPCVPFLQLACLQFWFQPLQTANCQAIKAMGRSDIYLKMEIWKKIIGVAFLVFAISRGVYAIAIACVISVFFSAIISMIPNVSLLKYSYKDQLLDISSSLIMSIIMLFAVYPLSFIKMPSIIILTVQILLGSGIYIALSKLFNVQPFLYLMDFIKKSLLKRNREI